MTLIVLSHIGTPNIYSRLYKPIFLTIYFFTSEYTWSHKESFRKYFFGKLKSLVVPLLLLDSINATLAIIFEGDS